MNPYRSATRHPQSPSQPKRRDGVRSSVIWEGLGVESLLLQIESSQLGWFGQLVRMPPGHLPRQVFRHIQSGGSRIPRTQWKDNFSQLAWERLSISPVAIPRGGGQAEGDLRLCADRQTWMDGCVISDFRNIHPHRQAT